MTTEAPFPYGHAAAFCPRCGPREPGEVDDDGECRDCGLTSVGEGIDLLALELERLNLRGDRLLAAARTLRDALRGARTVKVTLQGFTCPHCGTWSESMAAAVGHDATCAKHPAVIALAERDRR